MAISAVLNLERSIFRTKITNILSVLHLDDRDVLLVARREIRPGEELFLSCRNNRAKPMDEKERDWTTLQYGFLVQ